MPDAAEFAHPRLVALYESLNPYEPGTQPDFYADLAKEIEADTIIDLGCGTGLITCELTRRGFRLIAADPAPAMLAIARRRCGEERVTFIAGGSESLGTPNADLAIMTGHVAQFFVDDQAWAYTLENLHRALRPNGFLAFESRHPAFREWDGWTVEHRTLHHDPEAGSIEVWTEIEAEFEGLVTYANHYHFLDDRTELVSRSTLRFRTLEELESTLHAAGFHIDRVYGDWDRRPPGPTNPELIVVATS